MKTATRMTAAALAIAAVCALAPAAGARDYIVYSCKLPDGRPAPADGWSATGSAPYAWFSNTCASGGSIAAGLGGTAQPANVGNIGWGFDSGFAPIRAYRIQRAARIGGWTSGVSMAAFSADSKNVPGSGYVVDYCTAFTGCTGIGLSDAALSRSAPSVPEDSHAWFLTIGCGGYVGWSCPLAPGAQDFGALRIDSAAFTLADDEQPSSSAPEGSLTAEGAGSGNLQFTASDAASGVYRAAIEADGSEVAGFASAADGRCARIGLAGETNDFLYRRPCPAREQVDLDLPAGALAAGDHTIRARVYDAAGNGVTVFGPKRVSVKAVKGSAAATARIVLDGGSKLSATYGRAVRIAGTLEDNTGAPLANARIDVAMTSPAAARPNLERTVQSGGDGRFSLSLKATANRAIVLRHEPSAARADLRLAVRSRLTLRAAKRRVKPLGRMRLSGRIPSERARHGASVAIKVRSGRRWRTVAVVHATRAGAFKFSYRFRRTRHAALSFRAVALASGDLAVDTRPSRPIRIRVG